MMRVCIKSYNIIVEETNIYMRLYLGCYQFMIDRINSLLQPNFGNDPFALYERYIERIIQIYDI